MKIHIDLPWGGVLELQREPMDRARFESIISLIGGCAALFFLLQVVQTLAG